MTATDPNLTTGTRHYSLVSMATEAETTAREKWLAAGANYEADKSLVNRAALIDALDKFNKVQAEAAEARAIYKHNHLRRYADGSDNSMKASLEDAGLI